MRKSIIWLRQAPKRIYALFAVVAAAVIVPVVLQAYGPARPTFTIERPATYVTFNSITNNPNYGDERNFVIAKDAANTAAGGWSDNVTVEDGKEYIVRMYVHNNAAANLNQVATNTRVMANVPTTEATSIKLDGFVTADNANPQKVWDDVVFTSDKAFSLTYVAGSARYANNKNPNPGFALADSIVTNAGALVGYEALDGKVPGCFEYSGVVTFRVKVTAKKTPNFTVDKKVRVAGTEEWKDSTTAQPGQTVEYRVTYTNTGEVRQDNVVVKDKMDSRLTLQNGSSYLRNASNTGHPGLKLSDAVTSAQGVNVGNYNPKSNALVYYKATMPNEAALSCGVNVLKNVATVDTDNGSKSDEAEVRVEKGCSNPIKVCELSTKQIVTIEKSQFDSAKHSEKESDCVTAAPVKELPRTGPMAMIGVMIAMVAAGVIAAYFIRHRQEHQKQLEAEFGKHIAMPKVKLLEAHLTKKAKK